MAFSDEEGDCCDVHLAAAARAAQPPGTDYEQSCRAERIWQSRRAAERLWAEILQLLAGVAR